MVSTRYIIHPSARKANMLFFSVDEFKNACGSGVLIGLDIGTKTIGIAASDVSRTIATAVLTIKRGKWANDVLKIKTLINEKSATGLVAGYPINMDGSAGAKAQSIRDTAKRLADETKLPVLLWDERLSTMVVERMMIEADLSRARRDELVDKLASAYILQGALDGISKG